MSVEPYPTEWMDEVPYPGPDFHEPFYELNVLGRSLGKAVVDIFQRAFDELALGFKAASESISKNDFILWPPEPTKPPIADRDKPKGMERRQRHGPYEGSGYSHRGRKRY